MDSPFRSLFDSFSQLTRSLVAEDESVDNSHSVTVVDNILASDPLVYDPSPSLNLPTISTQPSLFSTPVSKNLSSANSSQSLFPTQPSPIPSTAETSQPLPTTQTFNNQLVKLRNVDHLISDRHEARAQSPILAPMRQRTVNDDGGREPEGVLFSAAAAAAAASLERENGDLKSEVAALRLQLEEQQLEINRLKAEKQQQPRVQPSQANAAPPSIPGLTLYISKKKRQRMRKAAAKATAAAPAAAAGSGTTLPPGCDSFHNAAATQPTPPLQPDPPPPPPPPSPPLPTLFIFHDSNLKGLTAEELGREIDRIKEGHAATHNINLQMTFTLPQTLEKIRHTTFSNNDSVIINILTNDARNTNNRQKRTPDKCRYTQMQILDYLTTRIPRKNITLVESPPLLDSPSSDIYPYNLNSHRLSQRYQINFARTLIGESHIWLRDGYHILRSARHLLLKSVAAAAAKVAVHAHFRLSGPPLGLFGPWTAPIGQGVLPNLFSGVAARQPINFRRLSPIRPLMGLSIRGPR